MHRTYVADIERGIRNVSIENVEKLMKRDDEREIICFRFGVPKNTPAVPIPFNGEVSDALQIISQLGEAAMLAFLLKMVLRDRITDDEVQLICDTYYHD